MSDSKWDFLIGEEAGECICGKRYPDGRPIGKWYPDGTQHGRRYPGGMLEICIYGDVSPLGDRNCVCIELSLSEAGDLKKAINDVMEK